MKKTTILLIISIILYTSYTALAQDSTASGTWPEMTAEQEAAWQAMAQRYQQQYGGSTIQFYDPADIGGTYSVTNNATVNNPNIDYTPKKKKTAAANYDVSPFAQTLMASRDAEKKARLARQQAIRDELNQINDNLGEQLNCEGTDCYDVYDNPEDVNEVTHIAPQGLGKKIDLVD